MFTTLKLQHRNDLCLWLHSQTLISEITEEQSAESDAIELQLQPSPSPDPSFKNIRDRRNRSHFWSSPSQTRHQPSDAEPINTASLSPRSSSIAGSVGPGDALQPYDQSEEHEQSLPIDMDFTSNSVPPGSRLDSPESSGASGEADAECMLNPDDELQIDAQHDQFFLEPQNTRKPVASSCSRTSSRPTPPILGRMSGHRLPDGASCQPSADKRPVCESRTSSLPSQIQTSTTSARAASPELATYNSAADSSLDKDFTAVNSPTAQRPRQTTSGTSSVQSPCVALGNGTEHYTSEFEFSEYDMVRTIHHECFHSSMLSRPPPWATRSRCLCIHVCTPREIAWGQTSCAA